MFFRWFRRDKRRDETGRAMKKILAFYELVNSYVPRSLITIDRIFWIFLFRKIIAKKKEIYCEGYPGVVLEHEHRVLGREMALLVHKNFFADCIIDVAMWTRWEKNIGETLFVPAIHVVCILVVDRFLIIYVKICGYRTSLHNWDSMSRDVVGKLIKSEIRRLSHLTKNWSKLLQKLERSPSLTNAGCRNSFPQINGETARKIEPKFFFTDSLEIHYKYRKSIN